MSLIAPLLSAVIALLSVGSTKQPPPREQACTHWKGTVSGNDPSVSVTATLCNAGGGKIRGTLLWESRTSGSNTRTIEGTKSNNTFTLRDVALEGRPNPGWRFCKVDRYTLSGDAEKLAGNYHSEACNDDATIHLERVR